MRQMDINRFGRRDRHTERCRVAGLMLLVLFLLTMEFTIGAEREDLSLQSLANSADNWAVKRFRDPTDTMPIPAKPPGVKRLAYISNSHARTGGFVSEHLQGLLEAIAPGRYEVLDLSDPGIFAPDMLQRLLAGLDYDLDTVILPVAYISFSDRMTLARQAFSARSFFKPSIVHRLPPGFWLRNYDLSVYGEALVSRYFRLFRYRNAVRDLWEIPLVDALKRLTGDYNIRFLEIDETLKWKFPTGFDQDLFDWSLYATGREGHLGDMKDLVETCRRARLPLLAFNLPVHWEKDPHRANAEDIARYRRSLAGTFSTTLEYVDYQDIFPKEFTTYDALHPTWHGARLHALDLALRLEANDLLDANVTPKQIVDAFLSQDEAVSLDYLQSLDGQYPALEQIRFRRYDIFEPTNARELLRWLASQPVAGQGEWDLVRQLSYRIYYWLKMPFDYTVHTGYPFPDEWSQALKVEIDRARNRTEYFQAELMALQNGRLSPYPIPDLSGLAAVREHQVYDNGSLALTAQVFNLPGGSQVQRIIVSGTDQVISYLVSLKGTARSYARIDLLGNGSFILIQPTHIEQPIPQWVNSVKPYMNWGL
jgi:hypothetical protein